MEKTPKFESSEDEWDWHSAGLEREAIALVKQYGFFIRGPVKVFFHKLADFLKWQDLKKEM
ncbi:MAG: hypothetical protein ACXW2U_00815 [Telluria sp.]